MKFRLSIGAFPSTESEYGAYKLRNERCVCVSYQLFAFLCSNLRKGCTHQPLTPIPRPPVSRWLRKVTKWRWKERITSAALRVAAQ